MKKGLAHNIRKWPWTDSLLGGGVIVAVLWAIAYGVQISVLAHTAADSIDAFKSGAEPLFDYVNWMVVTGAGAVIGRRITTKPEVIRAESEAAMARGIIQPEGES